MNIPVEGGSLYVEKSGSGPDVVLIHGRGQSSARVWRSVVAALQDRFSVTVYDQRGCFRSPDSLNDQSVIRHGADLLALLDALEIEHTQLIGFSFGGLIAQEAAFSAPERVDSLALTCTTCEVKPAMYPDYLARADRVERDGMAAYVDQGMARVLSPWFIRDRPEETAEYRRQFLEDDQRVYAEAMRAMTRWNGCDRLSKTTFPLMTIAADGDASPITANRARAASEAILRHRPAADFSVISNSFHYVQLEQLEALLKALVPFLDKHGRLAR